MWLGVLLCVVALVAWVFGEFMQRSVPKNSKPVVVCVLLLAAGYVTALEWGLDWRNKDEGVKWEVWTPAAVAKAREAGHPVLVDFTADWCASCQWTKKRALDHPKVKAKLAEVKGVAVLADWTLQDDRITKVLLSHKRDGVPLVLVYPVGQDEPIVLPVTLTPQIVLDALGEAGRFVP